MQKTFHLEHLDTPTGEMIVITDDQDHVRVIDWADKNERMQRLLRLHYGNDYLLQPTSKESAAIRALKSYFDGNLDALNDITTSTNGTEFQRQVWAALRHIPVGSTTSYGELAKRLGRPKAARAVGMANGSNPIAIVVPCHRVIGADASLTGFGGGIERKRWLLAHEVRTPLLS